MLKRIFGNPIKDRRGLILFPTKKEFIYNLKNQYGHSFGGRLRWRYLCQLLNNYVISSAEDEIYRKKSDRFDPMVVLERPGIYKIPVGKKGPDLSGIEEIDIASYSRWLNPALDKIRWYLRITPKEANNFAGRLNSKH